MAQSKIEELASRNIKPMSDPCTVWDTMVSRRMADRGESRDEAVDRLLVTPVGSATWNYCAQWDAAQPKIAIENGMRVQTGGNSPRRVPRKP